MAQGSPIGGANPPPNPNSWNPINRARNAANSPSPAPPGAPMAVNVDETTTYPGSVVFADASAAQNNVRLCGLASSAAGYGKPCHVQFAGPLTLTTDQWDAITGDTGGLRVGNRYYVSETGGLLQTSAPVGGGKWVLCVGSPISPTTMLIQVLADSIPL